MTCAAPALPNIPRSLRDASGHDVPRAKYLFNRLRAEKPGDPVLSTRLYNTVLGAYVETAVMKKDHQPHDAVAWAEKNRAYAQTGVLVSEEDSADSVKKL